MISISVDGLNYLVKVPNNLLQRIIAITVPALRLLFAGIESHIILLERKEQRGS